MLISLILAVVVMSSLAAFMGSQLARLASDLPHAIWTIWGKKSIPVVGGAVRRDTISRTSKTAESLAGTGHGQGPGRADRRRRAQLKSAHSSGDPTHDEQRPGKWPRPCWVPPAGTLGTDRPGAGVRRLHPPPQKEPICATYSSTWPARAMLQRTTVALDEAATRLSGAICSYRPPSNTCYGAGDQWRAVAQSAFPILQAL